MSAVNINGKYKFVSQTNFEEYLTAAGVGMLKRKVICATSPDIVVAMEDQNCTVTTITNLKTIKISFTLGKEYEADPGTDRKAVYLTTLEGNTLFTKEVANPESVATREFTDDGRLIMKMTTKGVTATRTFKKA